MNSAKRNTLVAIFSLLLSTLVPIPASAYDPGVITKTVAITNHLGQPYGAGARVGLVFFDSKRDISISPIVTSNASGIATLEVSGETEFIGLSVAPSASDTVHAIEFLDGETGFSEAEVDFLAWDQSFEIQLRTADTYVTPVFGWTGSTLAAAGTRVSVTPLSGGTEEYVTLLPGRVGLSLSQVESPDGAAQVWVRPGNKIGSMSTRSVERRAGVIQWPGVQTTVSGGVALRIHESTLFGTLRTNDGSPLQLPDGVTGHVRFVNSDPATGAPFPGIMGSSIRLGGEISATGSFQAFVAALSSTQPSRSANIAFRPLVYFTGSELFPSFLGEPFWVDPSGRFANSSTMTNPAQQLEIRMPSSSVTNVVFESVLRGTDTPDPSMIEIRGTNGLNAWWGNMVSMNGKFAYALPTGSYNVWVRPLDGLRPTGEHLLTVGQGTATLTRQDWRFGGPVQNIGAQSGPSRFKVSGSINNDINIVVTGDELSQSHRVVEAHLNYMVSETNGIGFGFGEGKRGALGIDLPAAGEFWPDQPVRLSVMIKPWDEFAHLDPTWVSREYRVDLSGAEPRVFFGNTEIPKVAAASGKPTFELRLGEANVSGNIVDQSGASVSQQWENNAWVNAQVQRLVVADNRWEYVTWLSLRNDGRFGVELPNGTYRISFEPNNFENVARTATPEFTISAGNPTRFFPNFALNSPKLSIEVVAPGSSSPLLNANIQLVSESAHISDWLWTGPRGRIAIAPAAGEYTLHVHPGGNAGAVVGTKKSYRLVVSNTSAQVFDGNTLVTPTSASPFAMFQLALSAPNLSGVVLSPTGQAVRHSQVVPIDQSTRMELWELSGHTDSLGRWAMSLPEGTYDLFARAPWGTKEFGSSAPLTSIQVDSNGQVVQSSLPSGALASALELRLSYPLWSGTVVDPIQRLPMADVSVCLFGPGPQECSTTNDSGQWSLSKPNGFTDFDGWNLTIAENRDRKFSERRYRDAEIESVLSFSNQVAASFRNITLSPLVPNLKILVLAGTQPAPNVWVTIDRPGFWLGGTVTDSEGYARLTIDNPEEFFSVEAHVSHVQSFAAGFSNTRRDFELTSASELGGVYSATVNLRQANFFGSVLNTAGSSPVGHGWVQLQSETGMWLGNSGVNASGQFSLTIPTASETVAYRLHVNPSGQQQANFSKTQFDLEITPQGVITVKLKGVTVNKLGDRFPLRMSQPNVRGIVVKSDGVTGVRDSWVVPISATENRHLWESGVNSGFGGSFAMNLEDGTYRLEASVPWNLTGLAKSARCTIVVASGVTVVADQSCQGANSGEALLKLRDPNLKFRLVKPGTTEPVPFAHVGLRVGDYYVHAQSDRLGVVSLFLDLAAMTESAELYLSRNWLQDASTSPGVQIPITFWIDPPGGSSDLVRWQCDSGDQQPLCSSVPMLQQDSNSNEWSWTAPGNLGDVSFKAPNTKVAVKLPNGSSVGEGAWVSLFKEQSESWGTWRRWIGGANTNRQGEATFLVEASDYAATFSVEVNAPWHLRSTYPTRLIEGLTLDTNTAPYFSFGQDFQLQDKNLTINVRQALGDRPSRWSWISVEKFENGTYSWLNGSGTDELGRTSLRLETTAGVQYRLTVHPGSGTVGVQLSCFVAVDSGRIVNSQTAPAGFAGCGTVVPQSNPSNSGLLVLTLSQGNTRGSVVNSSTSQAVAGAIVLAETGSGNATTLVSTVTNSRGEFFLQLDTSKQWRIKLLFANPIDPDPYIQRIDIGNNTQTLNDDAFTVEFTNGNASLKLGSAAVVNNELSFHRVSGN